jgi:hypothetical protein
VIEYKSCPEKADLTKNAKKVVSDRFVTAFENKSGQPANPVFMRVSAISARVRIPLSLLKKPVKSRVSRLFANDG